jgi:hypothetical protein
VLKAGGLSLDLASLNAGVTVEKPREPAPVASQGGVDCSLAAIHWTSTESIGTREAYKDHLARFPTCAFATLATARIAALDVKTEPAPAATPKSCARGLALTSDGECVREQAPKRVVVRRTELAPNGTAERRHAGLQQSRGAYGVRQQGSIPTLATATALRAVPLLPGGPRLDGCRADMITCTST